MTTVDADYLVVGAGAMGLAFTDALVDHSDARVVLVDRRAGVGGHWREAYPFVRLHQASAFYGVASTVFGGRLKESGPEQGLHERASKSEILAYFDRVLDRLEATGRVTFLSGSEYVDGAVVRSTGERMEVPHRCRIVDARYLSPTIPAEVPPPFAVGEGVRVVPVNDLAGLEESPSQYVIVGSGKTATDAIVRLLGDGTDPDAICWIRPREPWMFNRAVIQPDPALFLGAAADTWQAAASASSVDDMMLRLGDAGVLLRLDPSRVPTMARVPILGVWELELLRTVGDVVRLGHVQSVERGRITLTEGSVAVAEDALVVHCAARGLPNPPLLPLWQPHVLTLQTVRSGFPCFGAALTGYVEATRGDDAEKNRLCAPSCYGNTPADWVEMNVLGARNSATFMAEPDIKAWADGVALNPTRVPPGYPPSTALDQARARLAQHVGPGVERAAELVRQARA